MNKVAFVIPIHEKHYGLAQEFMQSFVKYGMASQSDLHFVLSTQQDLQSFDAYMSAHPITHNHTEMYGKNDNYGGGKAYLATLALAISV